MQPAIPADRIDRGERLRGLDAAQVASLAASIGDVGLLNPITVYPRPLVRGGATVDGFGLIAGAHRLAACLQLGMREIPAHVVTLGELERRIAECDENLCGSVLTPSERARFTRRRKEAYEALHPEVRHGAIGNGREKTRQVGDSTSDDRFTADTAAKTGQSERVVQRDAERGEKVCDEAMALLAGTRFDTGVYLDMLKRLPPDEQVERVTLDLDMDGAVGAPPRRANLRAAIGTDSATAAERGNNLYETPPEAMAALLSIMRFGSKIYEPACGRGAILRPLEDAGYDVAISDLVDYGTVTRHGECQGVVDFMTTKRATGSPPATSHGEELKGGADEFEDYDIVTNPPYGADLNRFVAHALRVHRPRRMALLLNLNFLCGFDDPDRCFAMDECPPATIWVFTRRLPMMHRAGWDGPEAASRMNTAWFVWELDEETGTYDAGGKRGTQIVRIDWKTFENSKALGPIENSPERTSSPVPADTAGGAAAPPATNCAPGSADLPSPLVGEGGSARSDGTDEGLPGNDASTVGAPAHPSSALRAPSPTRGEGKRGAAGPKRRRKAVPA